MLLLIGGLYLASRDEETSDRDGAKPEGERTKSSASPSPGSGWDPSPDSIAAVGDSITRAFDACSLLSDCPEASWVTGTDPDVSSLAHRLLDHPSRDSWNLAETGARMADLPKQMKSAASHDPELVTVMAGGNDACRPTVTDMTPVADFRADLKRAMRVLHEAAPGAQVYVSSVPDLKRLWSQGKGNTLGRNIWKLGICQSMLRDPQSTGKGAVQRRNEVQQRVVAYNTVLKEVCAEQPHCRYDDGAVFKYRFTEKELSDWDWFHPSRQGQHRLAQLAYRRITAP